MTPTHLLRNSKTDRGMNAMVATRPPISTRSAVSVFREAGHAARMEEIVNVKADAKMGEIATSFRLGRAAKEGQAEPRQAQQQPAMPPRPHFLSRANTLPIAP
jgi:hypothetical protein